VSNIQVKKICAECSTPLPHFRVFYDKSAFFSRKDVRRISIRSPASSALGAARATMTLTCSNIQRKIRWLGQIPSNIQVNYQVSPKVCGNWAECSTESASMIECWAQGSIKPKTLWFVPPPEPKMPSNKRKSVVCLLHVKLSVLMKCVTVWKSRRTFTLIFLGWMFDAMALSPVFAFDHSAQLPVCKIDHVSSFFPETWAVAPNVEQ